MNPRCFFIRLAGLFGTAGLSAQPSFTGAAPVPGVVQDAAVRRADYLQRRAEVLQWRVGLVKPGEPATFGLGEIAAKLALHQEAEACSARLIELMQKPSGDMFWMFPVTCISYLGRDQLTPAAKKDVLFSIREPAPRKGKR